jgi:hypothetical protein
MDRRPGGDGNQAVREMIGRDRRQDGYRHAGQGETHRTVMMGIGLGVTPRLLAVVGPLRDSRVRLHMHMRHRPQDQSPEDEGGQEEVRDAAQHVARDVSRTQHERSYDPDPIKVPALAQGYRSANAAHDSMKQRIVNMQERGRGPLKPVNR